MATCAEGRLTVSCHWSMWWQAQVPLEKAGDLRVRSDACLRLEAFCKSESNETYRRTIGLVCLEEPLIECAMHMAVFLYGVAVRADAREVVALVRAGARPAVCRRMHLNFRKQRFGQRFDVGQQAVFIGVFTVREFITLVEN